MGGFGSVFSFYIRILIYFFENEIIVRTSALSFVIQILIQAVFHFWPWTTNQRPKEENG